jgi:carboxyl-terminal processing protease
MNLIIQYMKRNYKILLVVIALSIGLWGFIPKDKSDPERDKMLLELLTFVIEKGHYDPAAIDDTFSKGIYKDYIVALDPSKRFFLQSDIDEFAKFETQLDDQIKNKDLSFFTLTYERLVKRISESKLYYKDVLASPFDYSIQENFNTDYEKLPYASNTVELKEKWRKQIKLSTLSSLTDKMKIEEDRKNGIVSKPKKPVSADKPAETPVKIEPKTFEQLEKETREGSLKSLNEYFDFIDDLDQNDWFSVYINAIATRFDPHTNYFPPDEKERFDVSISGKLEGIGARLQKKNDYTEITELISGGPAWKGKEQKLEILFLK